VVSVRVKTAAARVTLVGRDAGKPALLLMQTSRILEHPLPKGREVFLLLHPVGGAGTSVAPVRLEGGKQALLCNQCRFADASQVG